MKFHLFGFLICLLHDLGYAYEEDKHHFKSFQNFIKTESTNKKLYKSCGIPSLYENIYKKYFKYRIKEDNKNDHGICAAFIVFDNLCKIRKQKEHKVEKEDKLRLEKSLIKIYNFASWIILAHNIWYIKEDDNNVCIEPLKRIKDVSLLEKVSLEIKDDKKVIIKSDLNCGCHDVILNHAASLNDWLTTTKKFKKQVEIDLVPKQ